MLAFWLIFQYDTYMDNKTLTFASVAEAVTYLYKDGYYTVLYSAGPNKVRVMQNSTGCTKVIKHVGLLDVRVEDLDCYWIGE